MKSIPALAFSVIGIASGLSVLAFQVYSPPSRDPKNLLAGLNWIATPKGGDILLPPVQVSEGKVIDSAWSPDGKKLAIISAPPIMSGFAHKPDVDSILSQTKPISPRREVLTIYDQVRNDVRVVWRASSSKVKASKIQWFGSSQNFAFSEMFVNKDRAESQIQLVNCATGNVSELVHSDFYKFAGTSYQLFPSPTEDSAILASASTNGAIVMKPNGGGPDTSKFTFRAEEIDGNGNVSRTLSVPKFDLLNSFGYVYGSDGKSIYFHDFKHHYYQLHNDGNFELIATRPQPFTPNLHQQLTVDTQPQVLKLHKFSTITSELWLSSIKPSVKPDCLIHVGKGSESLAPYDKAVFYKTQYAGFVRRLIPLSDAELKAIIKREKEIAMKNAKQIGLALQMYSGDADGFLPAQGCQMPNAALPYAKNWSIFSGFNFTGYGLNISNGQSVAGTQIGGISVPGGTAVIYGNGSVGWLPGP